MKIDSKKKYLLLQILCHVIAFFGIITAIISLIICGIKGGTLALSIMIMSVFGLAVIGVIASDLVQRKHDEHEYSKWR